MTAKEAGMRSLVGTWVGDCIGNMSELYNVIDVLKALEKGIQQYGGQLPLKQFNLSDDTEESIVIYNHVLQRLTTQPSVDVDKLALELATRYFTRDPDGEKYGYGLMTRKVLRDIYEGVPWWEANKTFRKIEGTASHVDDLVTSILDRQTWETTRERVFQKIQLEKNEHRSQDKISSCGNGSAMRVAPLGALLNNSSEKEMAEAAAMSALPTHEHPEGIAGAMAIGSLAWKLARGEYHDSRDLFNFLDYMVPKGEVKLGLAEAWKIPFHVPVGKVVSQIGNGSHVTCQDTVPLCCWLTAKALDSYPPEEMYEKAITETAACGGDVDTNCAIVGGLIGIISSPPEKWTQMCVSMEGVIC